MPALTNGVSALVAAPRLPAVAVDFCVVVRVPTCLRRGGMDAAPAECEDSPPISKSSSSTGMNRSVNYHSNVFDIDKVRPLYSRMLSSLMTVEVRPFFEACFPFLFPSPRTLVAPFCAWTYG